MFLDRKKVKMFFILSLFFILISSVSIIGPSPIAAAPPTTAISVSPRTISGLGPGETFSVDIIATNVTIEDGLWGYQFFLGYDTDVLTAVAYSSYDPFLRPWPSEINETAGYVAVAYTMEFGITEGRTGDVPLAKVDFEVDALGASVLDLYETELASPSAIQIDHAMLDGSFVNVGEKMAVSPSIATALVNETFYIEVTLAEVSGEIWSYYFNLTYNPEVLIATNVTSLNPFSIESSSEINNTIGYVVMNYSVKLGEPEGFSTIDPTTIAIIGFKVDDAGRSSLELIDTQISAENGTPVPHERIHSKFTNYRDIEVTDISASPIKLLTGGIVTINSTVQNQGDFTETFNVTLQYSGTTIDTITDVSLDPGASKTLTFTWNTTSLSSGIYTLNIKVILIGDVNSLNNVSEAVNIVLGESQMVGVTYLYVLAIGTAVGVGTSAAVYSKKVKRVTRVT